MTRRSKAAKWKEGRPIQVGYLTDDPGQLARDVHGFLAYGDCLVWACDLFHLHACDPYFAPPISPERVAGTFRLGESIDHIKDDIACLRENLCTRWILDSGLTASKKRKQGCAAMPRCDCARQQQRNSTIGNRQEFPSLAADVTVVTIDDTRAC